MGLQFGWSEGEVMAIFVIVAELKHLLVYSTERRLTPEGPTSEWHLPYTAHVCQHCIEASLAVLLTLIVIRRVGH